MSRWADDPDRAAAALIVGCLEELQIEGRALLVNQTTELAGLLQARGVATAVWRRRLTGDHAEALPWPPAGPYDCALLRLPRARAEQRMCMHACAGVLAPGARLVVAGGNEEGIRPAGRMLAQVCGAVTTLASRGHGRVLAAAVPLRPGASTEAIGASLADWRTVMRLAIAGVERDWVTYPGLFAAGRIDEGTALMIGALPQLAPGARVLDYGCGAGAIGAAVHARQPAIVLDMLDNDAIALEAVRENVPEATRILACGVAQSGTGPRYHCILSNPPLHAGRTEDHAWLEALIADAPAALIAGGMLQLVVQRRVPLERLLARHFAQVEVAAQDGRYRVWRAWVARSGRGRSTT
jgi:16S rRNA (guanine1207-N2)-methyltransferase